MKSGGEVNWGELGIDREPIDLDRLISPEERRDLMEKQRIIRSRRMK
jgi:hypothetical protein